MKKLWSISVGLGFCAAGIAIAEPVRIASWNLGWHVSSSEVPNWIDRCAKSFRKDGADGVWKIVPATTLGSQVGWFIKESRAQLEGVDLSLMPPCGVFQTQARANVAVTASSYAKRSQQLSSFIRDTVSPDLIAFQEVSDTAAVREALGPLASEYEICSFDGRHKVQRLAFAWRRAVADIVEPCNVVDAISLPQASAADQVRPAYSVGLKIRGKLVRFLTVHLKSGCVTPLDGGRLDAPDSSDPRSAACSLLQQQIGPLETSIEQLSAGADQFIVLGDFNRNLWHEKNQVAGAKGVRSDGSSDLTTVLPVGVQSQNLLMEVNDAQPSSSLMSLLPMS